MTEYQSRREPWPPHRRFEPRPAVHWLSPSELVDAGVRAVISKIFGDYADRRETFGMLTPHAEPGDPALERAGLFVEGDADQAEFWFDYVSDVGDGFSPTFTIAETIARDRIDVQIDGEDLTLRRGQMLVMGGDEVYPTPSARAYRDRTTGPYEAALQYLDAVEGGPDRPGATLFAIPGNHDWYDGLSAFLKQFCSRQWIGAWKTRQHRSYFAIRLPHGWWLWGIDIAFDAPIDSTQMDYFRAAADELGPDDAVILATAKPSWKDCESADTDVADEEYGNLRYFVAQTIGRHSTAEVRLMLAGDKHFYARFSEQGVPQPAARHKIIAGGGGAYLSSTAGLHDCITVREPSRGDSGRLGVATDYELACAWPSKRTSRRLAWQALWRLPQTTRLYVLIGVLVAGIAHLVRRAVNEIVIAGLPGATGDPLSDEAARSLPISQVAEPIARAPFDGTFVSDVADYGPLWLAVVVLAVMLVPFAAKGSPKGGRPLSWSLAAIHALGYLAAAVASVWAASRVAVDHVLPAAFVLGGVVLLVVGFGSIESAPLNRPRRMRTPLIAASIGVVAWIALAISSPNRQWLLDLRMTGTYVMTLVIVGGLLGCLVLAAYLIGASGVGRNLNELFTAVRSEGYKNFLRMKIDAARNLHVWCLGVEDPGHRNARWDDGGNLLIDGEPPGHVAAPRPLVVDHITVAPRS